MRVTSSMYYENLYSTKNSSIQSQLFDVNKQIASGLQIQYAKDDVVAFSETMRLDNELSGLAQVKKSTENGYKMSNQTDVILNEFDTTMDRMRVLLIKAANASNSDLSLDAIAAELRTVEQHFYNLANSSINGQYLFSGSAVDVKPISSDGTYNGNNVALNSFTGSKTTQQYNVNGEELFLGEKYLVRRQVTSNVVNNNLIDGTGVVNQNSSIRELMGDTNAEDPGVLKHHFYVRGTQSDGTSFNQEILMSDEQPITALLYEIEKAYGLGTVDVSMNTYGEFVIQDKFKGSSKIEFNMVGAVDTAFVGLPGTDTAAISDPIVYGATAGQIVNLDNGETDFDKILNATSVAGNPNLHVKEFIKSGLDSAVDTALWPLTTPLINIDGLMYDRTEFTTDGSLVSSNVPQIIKKTRAVGVVEMIAVEDRNKFATNSTLLIDVASGAMNGTSFKLEGSTNTGTRLDVDINFAAGGSTFTDNTTGNTYNIYNMDNPRTVVDGDEMKYQHIMDVMNMAITGLYPTAIPGADTDYDAGISNANNSGEVKLSRDGKLQFQDKINSNTQANFAMYDSNSGDFSTPPSGMIFNVNDAVTVRDPKTDFFNVIDQMITSVENYTIYPDSNSANMRNIGIENAIAMMDDLSDHVLRAHAQAGSQSTSLISAIERTSILEIGTITLRSSVIDTDLAEASLALSQLTINYESMLSTVGKVSKLNLVNYL